MGTALGVTVTTIVFNRVVAQDARRLGLDPASKSPDGGVPDHSATMLGGYRAAQWTAFAFGAIGEWVVSDGHFLFSWTMLMVCVCFLGG